MRSVPLRVLGASWALLLLSAGCRHRPPMPSPRVNLTLLSSSFYCDPKGAPWALATLKLSSHDPVEVLTTTLGVGVEYPSVPDDVGHVVAMLRVQSLWQMRRHEADFGGSPEDWPATSLALRPDDTIDVAISLLPYETYGATLVQTLPVGFNPELRVGRQEIRRGGRPSRPSAVLFQVSPRVCNGTRE